MAYSSCIFNILISSRKRKEGYVEKETTDGRRRQGLSGGCVPTPHANHSVSFQENRCGTRRSAPRRCARSFIRSRPHENACDVVVPLRSSVLHVSGIRWVQLRARRFDRKYISIARHLFHFFSFVTFYFFLFYFIYLFLFSFFLFSLR